MSAPRPIRPAATQQIGAVLRNAGDEISVSIARFAARMGASVEQLRARLQAEAAQRRRDIDDEYDWIGEYRGRRG